MVSLWLLFGARLVENSSLMSIRHLLCGSDWSGSAISFVWEESKETIGELARLDKLREVAFCLVSNATDLQTSQKHRLTLFFDRLLASNPKCRMQSDENELLRLLGDSRSLIRTNFG